MKKVLFSTLFLFTCLAGRQAFYQPVYAAAPCNPADPNFGPCPAGLDGIQQVFGSVISVIVGLGFIVMLVMLAWSGYKFLISGGEPKAIQAARQAFTWAILGIGFMIIAWLALQIIAGLTGLPVTVFDIKTLCNAIDEPGKWCK